MNKEAIARDLIRHEGVVYHIYLDSEDLPTFGVGHLVTEDDPEYGLPVGTTVDVDRVNDVFEEDLDTAIDECLVLFPDLLEYLEPVQRVLVNMTFNLGRPRLSRFRKMIAAVEANDWNEAANQMVDSKWYRQVKTRGVELVELMRSANG